jgi:hypothetical protein
MTIFNTNFSNPFPRTNINSENPCYWIIYKSIPATISCNGENVSLGIPVAPEKINHNISYEWWAANQNRIQQIVPCDSIALDIDSSGKIPFCVISSSQDANLNSTRDCTLLYPEEQQLIQFLQNNNCDTTDSTNPVVIWYNDILLNNTKINSSSQKFFNSFTEACNNCDVFCNTCVPFSESAGVSSLLASNGSVISGNNVSIQNNTINLNNYFNTNLRPIVAYSKDSIKDKFTSSNSQLSSFNFTVPSKLGFDKALFINEQGQISSQQVVPGQIISLSDTIILGSTTTTGTLSLDNQLPPSPPTILSFRSVNSEIGSSTVITIAPNPRISNEDIVTSYAFRFNGVAFAPKRTGPAPAIQDGPEQLLENEYEFDGIFEGQYVSVASVGFNSIGSYGDSLFLGSGCCYISDGAVFDGTEESCQEYSTDRELSYTWSENSCVPTGSWNVGHLVTNSGLFKDKFYITGCQSGSLNDWISYYGSGIATNFRRNVNCSILGTGTVYDSFRMVPTGENINVIISPDVTITFAKVLSEGSINIQQTEDSFSFSSTASTSGNIGFNISKPSNFSQGDEIVSLADDGSLTSVPFSLSNDRINCPNIFRNLTHYYNSSASGTFTNSNYSAQTDYAPDVISQGTISATFGFAPSGFGFVSQFGQHYINLINSNSDQIYFVDAIGSRVDLSSYVSTSYLDRFVYPTPIISSSSLSTSDNNDFEACVAINPPQGWWDPEARDTEPNFALPLKSIYTELFNIPCENPFYTRGGYNIHDLFTFECGCWITLVTRQQLMDLAALIASLYAAITGLYRTAAALGTERAAKQTELTFLTDLEKSYLREAEYHNSVCDGIRSEYPQIPGSFPPPGFTITFPNTPDNPTFDDVLIYRGDVLGGEYQNIPWEEYLEDHPERTDLHDLNEAYSEWQRYEDNAGRAAEAEGRARATGWDIRDTKVDINNIDVKIAGCLATIAALVASILALKSQLDDFMQGPAVSYRKECPIATFEFCEHNEIYEICGGVAEPKAYWQKGYSPDGVRLTMPQGWPSCDCCAPCEACHPDPPSLGWSGYETPSIYSPCNTCPPGYSIMPGQPGPDYFVPLGDPPENPASELQCDNNRAPVCCFIGDDPDLVWNETNWSLWPFTDGPYWTNFDGVWGCYYIDPSTGFYITKEHYLAKRCVGGDCIGYCD